MGVTNMVEKDIIETKISEGKEKAEEKINHRKEKLNEKREQAKNMAGKMTEDLSRGFDDLQDCLLYTSDAADE